MIDLHTHSNCSDGDFSPEALVDMAKEAGLSVFAVSDHDTLEGSIRALKRGKEVGLEVVPAVEISASLNGFVIHVLGYYIDLENEQLIDSLREICDYRVSRAKTMVGKINQELAEENKTAIDMEEVLKIAKEKPVSRPDIAQILISLGHVTSMQEAFDRWLNKYNIPNKDLSIAEAIKLIHQAGGVAILAHPVHDHMSLKAITPDFEEQAKILTDLKAAGLDGIEVYRFEHTQTDENTLLIIARDLNFVITGGSDFHGPSNEIAAPSITSVNVPDSVMKEMRACVKVRL